MTTKRGHSAATSQHPASRLDLRTPSIVDIVRPIEHILALLVAWIATCGSLFFSEALGWLPCVLCWYQRILMYPLSILLAVGLLRRDAQLHWYVLPFTSIGACVSLYHYLLVKTDWLPPPPCVAGIPCTVEYLNWLGFINIPFLALTAFLLISFLMVAAMTSVPGAGDDTAVAEEDALTQHGLLARAGRPLVVSGMIVSVVTAFLIAARFV